MENDVQVLKNTVLMIPQAFKMWVDIIVEPALFGLLAVVLIDQDKTLLRLFFESVAVLAPLGFLICMWYYFCKKYLDQVAFRIVAVVYLIILAGELANIMLLL